MRKNKSKRIEKYKCNFKKCRNRALIGLYYRDEKYYCSKNCYKQSKIKED